MRGNIFFYQQAEHDTVEDDIKITIRRPLVEMINV